MSPELRMTLLAVRRALLMALSAVEDALGVPRSVASREDRRGAA